MVLGIVLITVGEAVAGATRAAVRAAPAAKIDEKRIVEVYSSFSTGGSGCGEICGDEGGVRRKAELVEDLRWRRMRIKMRSGVKKEVEYYTRRSPRATTRVDTAENEKDLIRTAARLALLKHQSSSDLL